MNHSNLAKPLEEFAAIVNVIDQPAPEQNLPRILAAIASGEKPAPRRLSRTARRIQISDQGLRPFRVF